MVLTQGFQATLEGRVGSIQTLPLSVEDVTQEYLLVGPTGDFLCASQGGRALLWACPGSDPGSPTRGQMKTSRVKALGDSVRPPFPRSLEPSSRTVFLCVNTQPSTPSIREIWGPFTLYSPGRLVNKADSWTPPPRLTTRISQGSSLGISISNKPHPPHPENSQSPPPDLRTTELEKPGSRYWLRDQLRFPFCESECHLSCRALLHPP